MKIFTAPFGIGRLSTRDYAFQFLLYFIPIVAIASIVILFAYHLDVQMVEQNLSDTEHHHMEMRDTQFRENVASAIADLRVLAALNRPEQQIPTHGSTGKGALIHRFLVFCSQHTHFRQIRIVTVTGRETTRIECGDGEPEIVPDSRLQDHVDEALMKFLPAPHSEDITMSGIDSILNWNNRDGRANPVIHFAMPMPAGSAEEGSIVVIDVDLRHLISEVMLDTGQGGTMILVEANGRFVQNPTGNESWGDTLRGGDDMLFGGVYPEVWQALHASSRGALETQDGLFTFSTLNLMESRGKDDQVPGGQKSDSIRTPEWHIISHVPRDDINSGREAFALKFILLIPAPLFAVVYLTHLALRRRRAAKDLEESETYLIQILDNMVDGVITTDPSGRIERANAATFGLFGFDSKEAVPDDLSRFVRLDQLEANSDLARLWRGQGVENQIAQGQLDVQRRDGSLFPSEILLMEAELGGKRRFIWMIRDISERQAFEAKQEAERMRFFHQTKIAEIGLIAGGIIHEVGNPIAALSSIVYQLAEEADENGQAWSENSRENLKMIAHQVDRLSIITREFSDFIRIRPGVVELFDLNFLIRSTVRLVQYDARWKHIRLELDLDPSIPAIMGIQDQISQVLMNLLVNAGDAVQDRPESNRWVAVRTEQRDSYVLLSIIDNGHGMSEEAKRHAFDSFFTTKPEGKGTGLGLSLCKTIIAAHQGGIEITSDEGMGAEFLISLPVSEQSETLMC